MSERCWLAENAVDETGDVGPCDGPVKRAHLIPQQMMRRELGKPAARKAGADPRGWVPGCLRHHDRLDRVRKLRIPRWRLPRAVEELAGELDALLDRPRFGPWLDREYGCA